MTFTQIMLDLATRLKDIGHTPEKEQFARNFDELLQKSNGRIDINNWTLLVDEVRGRLLENGAENAGDLVTGSFIILKNVISEDFDTEEQVKEQAKQIGLKIVAWFKSQKQLWLEGQLASPATKDFHIDSVRYEEVGPEFDNAFGQRFELTFKNSANQNLVLDPNDWND